MALDQMETKEEGTAAVASISVDLRCPSCEAAVHVEHAGEPQPCPSCGATFGKIAQLEQLLNRWFEPRQWRADLVKPSVAYLIEKLWTSNGQGERLYMGVAPKYTNYNIFRHLVTRALIEGVNDGWVELTFPEDPLVEDPQYELNIVDSERFAKTIEKLFPEVDWDETIEMPAEPANEEEAAEPAEK